MARGGRGPAACQLDEAIERDQRPDALQEQEAPLLVDIREDRQDRRADDVEDQVELTVDRQLHRKEWGRSLSSLVNSP